MDMTRTQSELFSQRMLGTKFDWLVRRLDDGGVYFGMDDGTVPPGTDVQRVTHVERQTLDQQRVLLTLAVVEGVEAMQRLMGQITQLLLGMALGGTKS